MGKILIFFLISISVLADPYQVNVGKLEHNFLKHMEGPNKCSVENYKQLLQSGHEIYVWTKFLNASERLNIQNRIYKKYPLEDLVTLDEEKEVQFEDLVNALKLWYHKNCIKPNSAVRRGLANQSK